MSSNNKNHIETLLVDVNPANENAFAYTSNLVTNLCVSNICKEEVEFRVDLLEPVKKSEGQEKFKLLPERFSQVGVNLDNLHYGQVNDCKIAIRANSIAKPDETQSILVNVSCLPKNLGEGVYEALVRYDISGFGMQKTFEKTQRVNVDNKALENEGIRGDLTNEKKEEREERINKEMAKLQDLTKNI
mmetsp:Transcript_30653/g.27847  ORF Transcript_30653/g.27847 Transcript_30653/m.27847 type:complete len:188 (+) Transcript_30653:173-736(+)|eukprot:CAMPEP_0114602256 /NCGR_PEP_ID=MMETSP0125-20121206/24860_1 /TAXON_ID=485358 ORGANISM="Aristerostoma sp., Strain ATCC 50986" /NCGR_SAMPLE_ID=MMETSP0125 /ASSEMBLY_ACC=CAM_ASM_000245 /LENGTH=187 /DNA_ID=CAMNT_0001812273 /DNA_START=84 /DNA_END=647 /DNA_ORIENTATION=-